MVKEDYTVGAVNEFAGPGFLDPRARNGHVTCRTTSVLNGSEGTLLARAVRASQQPFQQHFRMRLLAEQSVAQDLQLLRVAARASTCSCDLLYRINLSFCCRHLEVSFIPPDLFTNFIPWIQLPFSSSCSRVHAGSRSVNLLEHASNTDQVVAEDLLGRIEQLEYAFIAYRVVDVGPLFASRHDIPITQHRELLRSISRLDGETLADLVHCQLTLTQCVKDRDSQGVGQSLEEFCFEVAQLMSHTDSPLALDASIRSRLEFAR